MVTVTNFLNSPRVAWVAAIVAIVLGVFAISIPIVDRFRRAGKVANHEPAIGQHRRAKQAPAPWRKLAEDIQSQREAETYGRHAAKRGLRGEYAVFWDDLEKDLKDPTFRRHYTAASVQVAAAFNNPW